MTEIDKAVERVLTAAPPLTADQRDALAALLADHRPARAAA